MIPVRGRFTLIGLLIALSACAAGDDDIAVRYLGGGSPGGELQPEIIPEDGPRQEWRITSRNFVRPFGLFTVGDSLAIVIDHAAPFLHLIDAANGRYLHALNTEGDGGEPLNIYRVAKSPDDPEIFMGYSLIGGTLTTYRLRGASEILEVVESRRLSVVEAVDWPVWHSDGSVSVEPVRESSLRATVLENGEIVDHSGIALSALAPEWVPSGAWRDAMDGQTCPSPDRSRIARTFQYMGQLLILDAKGDSVPGARSQRFFEPQFTVRDPTGEVVFASSGGDIRLGYRSCAASTQHVFALFSGRRYRTGGGGRNPSSSALQIHIYDWNGRLRGGFRVQSDLLAIDLTADGSRLIGLEGGIQPTIVAYPIPRKFRSSLR